MIFSEVLGRKEFAVPIFFERCTVGLEEQYGRDAFAHVCRLLKGAPNLSTSTEIKVTLP